VRAPTRNRKAAGLPAKFAVDQYVFYWVSHVDSLYVNKMRLAMRRIRLNVPGWRTLAILFNYGPMTITQVAQFTVIERTALTRVVQAMETNGLVRRTESMADRRSFNLHITAKGRAKYAEALSVVEQVYAGATQGMDPAQIQKSMQLMIGMVRNLGGAGYELITDGTGESSR
jgi:DNA-binding MarR family transcriptional regulator